MSLQYGGIDECAGCIYIEWPCQHPCELPLMDLARATIVLVRRLGAGGVVLAQTGRWNLAVQPDTDSSSASRVAGGAIGRERVSLDW